MSKYIFFLVLIIFKQYNSLHLRGKRVYENNFPWLVQFQTIAPCGGVVVSQNWILTAAQCVQDKRHSIVLYATGFNQSAYIKATYIFPQYQAYSTQPDCEHNIALLKLIEPFDLCNSEITLPEIAPVKIDHDYKSCLIFGWQSYVAPSSKVWAKPIQYSEVILNSWKVCTYMTKGNNSYENVFCTMIESENGMKVCAGNPGSPVVCEDQYHRTVLLGIASWTNFSLECGGPLTYLSVNAFRDWINKFIFNNRRTEEWETANNRHTKLCKSEKYSKTINQPTSHHKNIDTLQRITKSNHLSGNEKYELQNIPIPKLQRNSSKSLMENSKLLPSSKTKYDFEVDDDYTRISTFDYHYSPYMDTIKDKSHNFEDYKKIGEFKHYYKNESRDKKLDYVDISYLRKENKPDELRKKYDNDQTYDNDDFDLIIPFNFEDKAKSSRINVYLGSSIIPYILLSYIVCG